MPAFSSIRADLELRNAAGKSQKSFCEDYDSFTGETLLPTLQEAEDDFRGAEMLSLHAERTGLFHYRLWLAPRSSERYLEFSPDSQTERVKVRCRLGRRSEPEDRFIQIDDLSGARLAEIIGKFLMNAAGPNPPSAAAPSSATAPTSPAIVAGVMRMVPCIRHRL